MPPNVSVASKGCPIGKSQNERQQSHCIPMSSANVIRCLPSLSHCQLPPRTLPKPLPPNVDGQSEGRTDGRTVERSHGRTVFVDLWRVQASVKAWAQTIASCCGIRTSWSAIAFGSYTITTSSQLKHFASANESSDTDMATSEITWNSNTWILDCVCKLSAAELYRTSLFNPKLFNPKPS